MENKIVGLLVALLIGVIGVQTVWIHGIGDDVDDIRRDVCGGSGNRTVVKNGGVDLDDHDISDGTGVCMVSLAGSNYIRVYDANGFKLKLHPEKDIQQIFCEDMVIYIEDCEFVEIISMPEK